VGRRDNYITIAYLEYLRKTVDFKKIRSIAWLGWTDENIIVKDVCDMCPNLEKSHMYDIDTSINDQVIKWDINKKWNISGYDLIICLRTSLFAESAQHFVSELKQTVENNKVVIFDFMLPELRPLMNYSSTIRKQVVEGFGLPQKANAFLSWHVPVIREVMPEEYSEAHKNAIKSFQERGGLNALVQPTFTKIDFYRKGIPATGGGGYSLMPKFDKIYKSFYKEEVGVDYDTDSMIYVVQTPDVFLTEEMLRDNGISLKHPHFLCAFNLEPETHQSVYDAPDYPEMWSFTLAVIERE
tara:strand:+ start:1345 stop:2235 length:891 start_codon:yes stop_codon:yes gene_type:complete